MGHRNEVEVTDTAISPERLDEFRCSFSLDRSLQQDESDGPVTFTGRDQAAAVPAAQAVMDVAGIRETVVDGARIIVTRTAQAPDWDDLIPRVQYALGAVLRSQATPAAGIDGAAGTPADDDEIYDRVADIFNSQINPIVAQHGGAIDLIDVQDATVVVRMSGGCQGCGMANVTLRQGIEAALHKAIPALAGVRDITDHASGSNPYFASSGK